MPPNVVNHAMPCPQKPGGAGEVDEYSVSRDTNTQPLYGGDFTALPGRLRDLPATDEKGDE